jgi:Ca-activated chloride channel homolog
MYRTVGGALALSLLAAPLAAQGWIEVERRSNLPANQAGLTRVSSEVRTVIDGRIIRVEVEERFRNSGGTMAEGTYLYPLPGEAVFQNFSLWMGEQEVRGEMMGADQARGIYEEIVRRKRDPALLTLAGHGLVRAQVFPVQPGETRKVVLRYTQLAERAGDALRVRYALGQRGEGSGSYRLTLADADAWGTPYSPTHEIHTRRDGERLIVEVEPRAGGDVELFLPLRRGLVGTTVLAHAPGGEDGYFMLLLAPPMGEQGPVVPRDVAFVVDVSGSMSGDKLEQAKSALRQALETLGPEDRFRLVAFSSGVRQFRDGYVPATAENRRLAREYIDQLVADGGTNIAGALDAVLGSAVSSERLPIVLFMTDGIPSVGEQEPDRIAAAAAGRIGRTRIFTFGIGQDVNTYLLDRLAREGRGSAAYVGPETSVESAVGGLVNKIRRPALVNLRLVRAPVRTSLLSPAALPDLFYGEELVVFGRYDGDGSGPMVIEGERNGRREQFTTEASFPASAQGNEFIAKLWASRRIGDLTRQIRLEGSSDALVREVRDLGLRYGVLTEYTSYLVQEPQMAMGPGMPARDSMGRGLVAPMAAPANQTGAVAFERAQRSSKLAAASTLQAADEAASVSGYAAASGEPMTRAGGRVFVKRNGVWTDAAHGDSLRVIEVAPYSDAYFALLRALPELVRFVKVGDTVLIAGRRASIKLVAGGATTLGPNDLTRAVRDFRGRA